MRCLLMEWMVCLKVSVECILNGPTVLLMKRNILPNVVIVRDVLRSQFCGLFAAKGTMISARVLSEVLIEEVLGII